jgi:hypothetical protein
MTSSKQVKVTLKPPLSHELDLLCINLGLPPASVVKLAIKRLAKTELHQTASPGIPTPREAA